MSFDIVIPTSGRPSLARTLAALAGDDGPAPGRIVVVDDRRAPAGPLPASAGIVVPGPGRGPAAARNAGLRATRATWVVFLDDDVVPAPGWRAALAADLRRLPADVAGSQGRLEVPLPPGRRPTGWERNVTGLAHARWATADMAYRRGALEAAGGFDEAFGRAYREDADLALRLLAGGWRLVRGTRRTVHRVGPAGLGVSLRLQAGNADDVLMRRRHGRGWREPAGAPPGRRPRHVAVTGALALTLSPKLPSRVRGAAAAAWLLGTAELVAARVLPGPRTPREVTRMLATSALLPPLAVAHAARGAWRHRAARPARPAAPPPPAAVLFDRDGTLVVDVPYNGDPARVVPMPGAREAVARLRARGVRVGVITNQSGVARGLLDPAQVADVALRIDELVGPMDVWQVCPHGPEDGCGCRQPAPGLVLRAAGALGLEPGRCVVVGDIGADVEAAAAAGAASVLVPNGSTRPEEITAAPRVAPDLLAAVAELLPAEAGG
jgi:HAD superfamily hydrolase (TIGR01662 family)